MKTKEQFITRTLAIKNTRWRNHHFSISQVLKFMIFTKLIGRRSCVRDSHIINVCLQPDWSESRSAASKARVHGRLTRDRRFLCTAAIKMNGNLCSAAIFVCKGQKRGRYSVSTTNIVSLIICITLILPPTYFHDLVTYNHCFCMMQHKLHLWKEIMFI